jgi:riboflavin biosynthesis pyrimidine reductase
MRKLRVLGIKKLLVEGGARIITGFFCRHLVDRYIVTITPTIVGGLHAIEQLIATQVSASKRTKKFPEMKIAGYEQLGKDLAIYGTIIWQKR